MRDGPYPAQTAIVCDVPALLRAVAIQLAELAPGESTWTKDEIASWKQRLEKMLPCLTLPEPKLAGVEAREFFAAFLYIVPPEIPIATDRGLHQYLVRSYLRVLAPRTLLVPADFQSMGFGILNVRPQSATAQSFPEVDRLASGKTEDVGHASPDQLGADRVGN